MTDTTTVQNDQVVYLTNALGENTGYGTLDLTESDYELVGFEMGPGIMLNYIAECRGMKVLLSNLDVFHKDDFWSGDDEDFPTMEEARERSQQIMADIQARLGDDAWLVPLEEGDPGRYVVGVAIPLSSIRSREEGMRRLEETFGPHALC